MKIKLSQLARTDLHATKSYISQDKPDAAIMVMQRVMKAIEHIAAFPSIGRRGRVPNTKEFVVSGTPLIIIYQVKQDGLFIVRVIHAARKWPRMLKENLDIQLISKVTKLSQEEIKHLERRKSTKGSCNTVSDPWSDC